ncbi:anti-sigma regulatory factor [soil metagenome]
MVFEGQARTARRAEVVLTVPADGVFLAVVRTATAGLAARLDLTLDDIEDLRIAVDEACALLLQQARVDSAVTVAFTLTEGALNIQATATCDRPELPSRDGFSWTVLAALTTHLDMWVDGSDLVVSLDRARDDD